MINNTHLKSHHLSPKRDALWVSPIPEEGCPVGIIYHTKYNMLVSNKTIITLSILSLLILGAGCGQQSPTTSEEQTTATTTVIIKQPARPDDPAEKFCKDSGYELIIRFDQETQSSKSFCRFPDISECDASDFYNGTCLPGQNTSIQQSDDLEKEDINVFTACSTEYLPVCGQDQVTYTNSCLAQIQGIIISHEGSCIESNLTTPAPIINSGQKTVSTKTTVEDSFSDLPPTADTSALNWMAIVKDFMLSAPPNNPRSFIEKCNYSGAVYYFQSDGCADCFSILYNENGDTVCYPSNDLNGSCPGSFSNKNRPGCTRFWTDER